MQAPWPVKGNIIVTSEYGPRTKPRPGFHYGIDLVSDQKEIYANVNGILRLGDDPDGFGKHIMLVGATPQGTIFLAIFGHLDPHFPMGIQSGKSVAKGEHIAIMDSTGDSTGIHLHFEFRVLQHRQFFAINPREIIIPTMALT